MSGPSLPQQVEMKPGGRGAGGADRRPDARSLGKLFEKLPPHAIEAEMSLLGSMLVEPEVIGDVVQVVRGGDDFYKPAHGAVYDVIVKWYDDVASMDLVQLNQLLVDQGILDDVGGANYLVQLAESVPSAAHALHYARMVREKSMIRRLIATAGELLHEAYQNPNDAQRLLDTAEHRIFQIAQDNEQGRYVSLPDLLNETMERIEANAGVSITGVPSGFLELDKLTTGFQSGELIIVAARPSMGKTAFALNVAEQMALAGHAVGFFSLEMGKQQLVQRMLCARSGVDSQKLRRNMLNKDELHRLIVACGELQDAPIYLDDTPGLTILQLRAKARRMVQKHAVKAIFVDYIQLLSAGIRVESRQMEVSEISRSVKAMARELEVPVLCLSQLNRAAEQREDHRPRMSELRESGSLEQDADVVSMLHREEYYHQADRGWAEENPEKVGLAEFIIAKQRNGPTDTVKLTWAREATRFRDYSPAHGVGDYYPRQRPQASQGRADDLSDLPI